MTTRDAPGEVPQSKADPPAPIPAMPDVRESEVFRGRPYLLADYDVRHSIGWQDDRKAGRGFVVARLSRLDAVKVTERFQMNEQGWAGAWQALASRDPDAASAIAVKLADRAASRSKAAGFEALDAESLSSLRRLTYKGGSGTVPLVQGTAYDLRLLDDKILVCRAGSAQVKMEVPYGSVEAVEIGGHGQVSMSTGESLALVLGLGLVGALLGLAFFGRLGQHDVLASLLSFLTGAMLFGLAGAMAAAAYTKIETSVRIRTDDAELRFLDAEKRPEDLRFELSGAFRAIHVARAVHPGDHGQREALIAPTTTAASTAQTAPTAPAAAAKPPSASISDELTKLGSLLEQGLITRDEFDHLKARLIAKS